MKKRLLYFFLFSLIYAWFGRDGLHAQTTTISADCIIKFSFAVSAAPIRVPTLGFPNKIPNVANTSGLPCTTWALQYQAPTTVSAISIQLDSANDTAGAAGTWAAFNGSTVVGSSNPDTTTGGDFLVRQGFNAWVSVKLNSASGSGTITGVALGWVVAPFSYSSTTVTPSGTQDVNIIKYGGTSTTLGQKTMAASIPVTVASDQSAIPVTTSGTQTVQGVAASGTADSGNPVKVGGSNGTNDYNLKVDSQGNNYNFLACPNSVDVALSGTGLTEIVAGVSTQVVYVCKVFVTSVSGGNPVVNTFTVSRATVTTCASATQLALAGGVTGLDSDYGGALRSGAGQSICVSESVGNTDKVTVTYAQF